MTWRFDLLEPDVPDGSMKWAARCKAYWTRQQAKYGLRLSDFTMLVDHENRRVYTHCMVLDVLPGPRVHWHRWKPAMANLPERAAA